MQTAGVTARSCITDPAASNAFDAVNPRMMVAFRPSNFHSGLRAGTQALHRVVMDRPDRALTCAWYGEERHPGVERPDADVTSDAAQRAAVPSMRDVPDMGRGAREPAFGKDRVHGHCIGPVR
jgi:hypothetical protein